MLSIYATEFASLAAVHFLIVVAPGPDFAILASQTIRHGRRIGLVTALGIGAGISIHVLYTLLGVGALIHTTPAILRYAKILGALYLLFLGWGLIRKQHRTNVDIDLAPSKKIGRNAFFTGFLSNALNPKATLFFLAVFTTLVSVTTPMGIQIFYGIWMCIINAAWFSLVSVLLSHEKVRETFLRKGHLFERLMGTLLIGFAVRLLWHW